MRQALRSTYHGAFGRAIRLALVSPLIFCAAAIAASRPVSHVVIHPDAPIKRVQLADILPQPLAPIADSFSPQLARQLRSVAADMGMQYNSVLVFGTDEAVILLPQNMLDVAERLPVARISLQTPGDRKRSQPERVHLQSEGLAQLTDHIREGNYQQAFEALSQVFDANGARSKRVSVVEVLPTPSEVLSAESNGSLRLSNGGRSFDVLRVDPFEQASPDRTVVYRQDGFVLTKESNATADDFQDIYVIKTPLGSELFSPYGNVVSEAPGRFVVMRVRPIEVAALSRKLHEARHLGALIKLNGSSVRSPTETVLEPRIPVDRAEPAVVAAQTDIDADQIHQTVDELAGLFTRYHKSETGKGVAALLAKRYESYKNGRGDVSIQLFPHSDTPQPSLIVRITGQTFPDEVVILGSHIDSINHRNVRSRAPGADDDASGTATNLEIFRVLMARGIRPERTIEIHGYAAEEIGLVGSQEIAQKYAQDGRKVVAMLQMDMNLFKRPGAADKIWFIKNESDSGLIEKLGSLASLYLSVDAWSSGRLFGGGSDQQSWLSQGYPAVFPTENPQDYNPDIHTTDDTTETKEDKVITFDQAGKFAKLGLAFIAHFAGIFLPPS